MKIKSKFLLVIGGVLSVTSLIGCSKNNASSSTSSSEATSAMSTSQSSSSQSSSSQSSTSQTPTELAIVNQPQDVRVAFPNSVDFSLSVNNPALVKSYQWQYFDHYVHQGDDLVEVWLDLRGINTHSNTLHIVASQDLQQSDRLRCQITDINDKVIYSDDCCYTVTNLSEHLNVAYIGEYALMPGDQIDLSTTPYGKGIIKYDSNGVDFTFDNVHFINDFYNADPRFGEIGFGIENDFNTKDTPNYSITFIGENIMTNNYWEDDHNQGGSSFYFGFNGVKVYKPTMTLKGSGSLTILGGTYGFISYCELVVDIDLNLLSIPKRLTKGILADSLTIKENRHVNASLGGTLFFVEYCENKEMDCTIHIEKNTSIQANIDCGSVSQGDTAVHGMYAAGPVEIVESDIVINVSVDMDYFDSIHGGIASCECIGTPNAYVFILKSNVNFSFTSTDSGNIQDPFCNGVCGLSAIDVNVNDSKVNIYIDCPFVNGAYGIYSNHSELLNTKLDIFVNGYTQCNGISCSTKEVDTLSGVLTISNSNVNIFVSEIVSGVSDGLVDGGIKCKQFDLTLDKYSEIKIDTPNLFAFVVTYEVSLTPKQYEEGYVAKYISLNQFNFKFNHDVTSVSVNVGNYKQFNVQEQKNYYVNYETIFDQNINPVDFLIIGYKA